MTSFMRAEAQELHENTRTQMLSAMPLLAKKTNAIVFSHITAVTYWGSNIFYCRMNQWALHISVKQQEFRPLIRGIKSHVWKSELLTYQDGAMQIAKPEVCWAQIARYASEESLIKIADTFMCRNNKGRILLLNDLIHYVETNKGFHGRAKCLKVLPFLIENTDSPQEALLIRFLMQYGFGKPVANYCVKTESGNRYIDVSYPDLKLGFEYQGAYHADIEQMRKDADKHNQLMRMGWKIIYVTTDDLGTQMRRERLRNLVTLAVEQQRYVLGVPRNLGV